MIDNNVDLFSSTMMATSSKLKPSKLFDSQYGPSPISSKISYKNSLTAMILDNDEDENDDGMNVKIKKNFFNKACFL